MGPKKPPGSFGSPEGLKPLRYSAFA